MTGKYLHGVGLFLAAAAAFSLGLGTPRLTLAASDGVDLSRIDKLIESTEGKAALARAGIAPDKLRAMFARLAPAQRRAIEKRLKDLEPRARLGAKMIGAGYTRSEVEERLGLLTEDEIARLADDPEAMTSGTSVSTVFLLVLLVLAAVLVAWYFVALEEPSTAPELEPPPAT